MARLYAGATGALLRLDLGLPEGPPGGTAATLDFDADTNGDMTILARYRPALVTLRAGVVQLAGQPYTPQPASATYQQFQAVAALAGAFLGGTDLTLAQLNQVMRWLARRQLAQGD